MRAIVHGEFGEPRTVLRLEERAPPAPGPGELLVRMLACPVNPSDLMVIRGRYNVLPRLPATPGFEGVGIVESAGRGLLGKLLVGKRIALLGDRGVWSELAITKARQVFPVPQSMPLEQAAMFFINPLTAYIMTRIILNIQPGHWLLQTAAGSAVGRMVIRLGREFGFKTLSVVRNNAQVEALLQLGGDAVIACEADALVDDVRGRTGGQGVPFAIDPVGGALGSAVVRCLARRGRMLVFGTLSNEPLSFSPRDLMAGGAAVQGFWLGGFMATLSLFAKLKIIRAVSRLIQSGVLSSSVHAVFPMKDVAAAVEQAEASARDGKVLITFTD